MPNPQSEYLKSISEQQFALKCLMPLYRKMGFNDVEFYHGGILEQGKDLTMWLEADGERRNYAVVVKKGDLSGAVTGSNNAGQVSTQVRQCFGTSFKDKRTLEERPVHFCYVVASGSISKETRHSLESLLGEFRDRLELFGGDDILVSLREHGLVIGEMAQLHDFQANLAQAITDADITVTVGNNNGPVITVAQKPGSQPPKLGFKIKIDQSEEGKLLHKQLKEFQEQGGSIRFPGSTIELTKVPEVLQKLGFAATPTQEVTIQQLPFELGTFSLVWETDDHERAALDGVILILSKRGNLSGELRTKPGSGAFEFYATFFRDPIGMNFVFTPAFPCRNVKEVHDVLKFELALREPGDFSVVDRKTGLSLFAGRSKGFSVPDHVSVMEKIFSQLVTIQNKTGRVLTYSRELTDDDLQQMQAVYAVVTTGSYLGSELSFVMAEPSPQVEVILGKPETTRFSQGEKPIFQILDTNIDLGPLEILATDCTFYRERIDELGHHFVLKPEPGTISLNFPEWQRKLSGGTQSS